MAPGPPAMDEGIPAMPTVTKPSPASTVTPGPVPQKRKQNASGSSKGKGKGKGSGSEDDDEEDEDGRKRKRNRMALSCRECKRRKVKCDRSMPSCGPCTKRGQASACTWDVFSTEGFLPPSIARTVDVVALADRLKQVEAYLQTLPPNLGTFKPFVPVSVATPGQSEVDDKEMLIVTKLQPEQINNESFSDTEDAAVNLENGVFGRGLGAAGLVKMRSGDRTRSNSVAGGQTSRFGGVRNMEFTKALTCIVSMDRGPGTSSYSKVHLDVNFDASPAEVEFARMEAIRRIFRVLPPRAAVTHLVQLYFSRVSWLFHHVHAPSFLAELDSYHAMCDAGRADEVDISWIALLLMILCVALDGINSSRSPLSLESAALPNPLATLTDDELRALPETFFQASQRALAIAEWESIPRIRSIQTIVLFTQYLQLCSANRGQPSQLVTWLSGAIRIAQVLGLHLLGSNPEVMPPDDPAYPPGKNSLKRESAKRLWGVLVFQDWMGASAKNRCYLISPYHFDTDDPSNLNDVDLSAVDWRVSPAPQSILTDSTPDRVRIAMSRQVRRVFDAVVLTKDFSYETVLELDRGFRSILEVLPARWTSEQLDEAEQPMLRYQRHFALEGLHNRIFRLHRPFSTRGYRQEKYKPSTDACVKSAQTVIISTHNISEATKDVWWTYSHCMGAALVLFNDLFYAIDQDFSAGEIDAKRSTLHLVLDIFSRSSTISSPSLQNVVQQGAKILTGLFRAEEQRRAGRAARTLVTSLALGGIPDDEKEGDVETFAEVLQRISRSLNSQTERHRGTPPPTRNLPLPNRLTPSYAQYPATTSQHIESVAPPWPFPSLPVDPADDLSLQFYEDLGMLESSMPNQSDFWSDPTFGGFDSGEILGNDWEADRNKVEGLAAASSQISTLLEQLQGSW